MPLLFMILFRSLAFLLLVGAGYHVEHHAADLTMVGAVVGAAIFWQVAEWLQSIFMRNG